MNESLNGNCYGDGMNVQSLNGNRLLLEAALTPMQGQRFQPTGFADLGAATYTLPDGTRMLLVESAQSMANRLENTIIQPDGTLIPALTGLSYMEATLTGLPQGEMHTSSLVEAHRINSPYFSKYKQFQDCFCKAAKYAAQQPLHWPSIAEALFKYDVNALLHGVFFSNIGDGRIKMPRLISAFIEAKNVQEVVSGGAKFSYVDPSGKVRVKKEEKKEKEDTRERENVYGNVPYQRTEYTAESITAYFNVDVSGIRALGLPEEAQNLLFQLALYKIRALLDGNLRLRTACDFRLVTVTCQEPEGFALPALTKLETALKKSITACKPLFADPAVTRLSVPAKLEKKKTSRTSPDATDETDDISSDDE